MLQIKNLTYKIKEKTILNDITLSFAEKKITGIIGPNGCGKSTLLAHISGLLKSHGEVTLDGTDIRKISARAYARKVAILAQQQEITIENFSVKDIVLMGRYPYKKRFHSYSAADTALAASMMQRTGVDTLADKHIKELSGGERQRVFITKALTQQPDILLLDEPTNHLDIKYKITLMRQLQTFGKTIIIVLHDLSLAARYCDNIVIMRHGKIIAKGSTQETLQPALLKEIFEVPFYTASQNNKYFLYY